MAGSSEAQSGAEGTRRLPLWAWLVLWVVLLLVAALTALWLTRTMIAETALKRWCKGQSLACEVSIDRLGFGRVEASGLRIASDDGVPVEIESLAADLKWRSLFMPSLAGIEVDGATVRGRYRDETFDAYGLEKLIPADSGEPSEGPTPRVLVRNTRVELDTEAGPVAASVTADGVFPENFSASFELTPVQLESGGDRVSIEEGQGELTWKAGVPQGTGRLAISRAELDGLTVNDLEADFSVTPLEDERFDAVIRGRSGAFVFAGEGADRMAFEVTAAGSLPESGAEWPDMVAGLVAANLSADLTLPRTRFGTAEKLIVDAELRRTGEELSGPVLISFENLVSQQGSARLISADGAARVLTSADGLEQASWRGGLVLREAAAGAGARAVLRELMTFPQPMAAHGRALGDALSNAASGFDAGLNLNVEWRPSGYRLEASRATRISAATGFTASVTPSSETPWLVVTPEQLRVEGDVALSGGGAPDFAASFAPLSIPLVAGGAMEIAASPLVLLPWTVEGLTVETDLDRINYASDGRSARAAAMGEVALDGRAYELELGQARVFGGVEARLGEEGWRVQMAETDCLAVSMRSLKSGSLVLEPTALSFCPVDKRLLRREGNQLIGAATMGDVSFGISSPNMNGEIAFAGAEANWTLTEYFTLQLTAADADMPLTFPGGTVAIAAKQPDVRLALRGNAPGIAASLGRTDLSGSLIPARLRARSLTFDGRAEAGGIRADGRFEDVVIVDLNTDDPMYEPLNLTGGYTLQKGTISAEGDLRLNARTERLAAAALELNLITLDGTMTIAGERITFARNGLQPNDISDRLTGLFTNASGVMQPRADLIIDGGNLKGTGEVVLDGLSWSTFRLGSVKGVSGTVAFDDVVGLTTPPGQTIRIAELNPGIPLTEGEIVFQLLGAKEARLEYARWPFAGGELYVQPTRWTVQSSLETIYAELRKIELDRLVKLLKIPDLSVSGTASGTFPVVIEGADVLIRDAVLKADENGGTVRYTSSVAGAVTTGGATAEGDVTEQLSDPAKLTFDALRNFEFSVLSMTVNGNLAGVLSVGVQLFGYNPRLLDGQRFQLNINVEGPIIPLIGRAESIISGRGTSALVEEMIRSRQNGADEAGGQDEEEAAPDTPNGE